MIKVRAQCSVRKALPGKMVLPDPVYPGGPLAMLRHRYPAVDLFASGPAPTPRFGASDCRCTTHLIYFAREPELRLGLGWSVIRRPKRSRMRSRWRTETHRPGRAASGDNRKAPLR